MTAPPYDESLVKLEHIVERRFLIKEKQRIQARIDELTNILSVIYGVTT